MLVDDSAVIRGLLSKILEREDHIKIVQSVSNGEMAVNAAGKYKPDIVILDVEMPVMDGLTALPKILEVSPQSKIIMFSSLTAKGADVTMKAMSLGAVECLVKPSTTQGVSQGSEFEDILLRLVNNLYPGSAQTKEDAVVTEGAAAMKAQGVYQLHDDTNSYKGKPSIVAIGSSTGGPQALFNVIKNFEGFDIPIIVTQHMPATFTKILAEHIQQQTGLPAHEGEEGMIVENGHVYVAPGGKHMLLKRGQDQSLSIVLDDGPPENFCKPSVEPMYRSAIDVFGNKVLGVILTGMGNDGHSSAKNLVERGGRLIAQDEETSVVWGMPGAVAKKNICSAVLPLDEIGPWVRSAVMQ
jgi:two-component system chemotaxis response regulator CheB